MGDLVSLQACPRCGFPDCFDGRHFKGIYREDRPCPACLDQGFQPRTSPPASREAVAAEAWGFNQMLARRDQQLEQLEAEATAAARVLDKLLEIAPKSPEVTRNLAGQLAAKVDLVHEIRKMRADLAGKRISRAEVGEAMERRCSEPIAKLRPYRLRQLPEWCEPCASRRRPAAQRRLIQAVVIILVRGCGMEPVALCADCAKRWAPEALGAAAPAAGGPHG